MFRRIVIPALIVSLAAAAAVPAHAQTQQGDWSLSAAVAFQNYRTSNGQSDSWNTLALQGRLTTFLTDQLEGGVSGDVFVLFDDDDWIFGKISGDVIYNLDMLTGRDGGALVPYIGIGAGIYFQDFGGESDTWPEVHGRLGAKYFLSENTSLFVEYNPMYVFADDDLSIFINSVYTGLTFYWQ